MKLVNIEIIKDELERLIRNYRFYSSTEAKYRYEAYTELSEWLDGLEVKETSKDLEEAATKYARKQLSNPDYPTYNDEYEMECAFEAGAQWQKEHTIYKACNYLFSHMGLFVTYFNDDIVENIERSEFIKKFRIAMEE